MRSVSVHYCWSYFCLIRLCCNLCSWNSIVKGPKKRSELHLHSGTSSYFMEAVSGTLLLAHIIWGNAIPYGSGAALVRLALHAAVDMFSVAQVVETRAYNTGLSKVTPVSVRAVTIKMGCNITFWEWPRAIWRTARDCNINGKLVRSHLWYDYKELFRHSQLESREYFTFIAPKFPGLVRLNLTGHYEDENMRH